MSEDWTKYSDVDINKVMDKVKRIVFKELKNYGFTMHGSTFHRFVDGDISQVIGFQRGQSYAQLTHIFWLRLGIRVPECVLQSFEPDKVPKKYYKEYECNIRAGLQDALSEDITYNLSLSSAEEISKDIIEKVETSVLPVFDILCNRDAILNKRREYPNFDTLNFGRILLEEAMIYGRRGDIAKASEVFSKHCKYIKTERKQERIGYLLEAKLTESRKQAIASIEDATQKHLKSLKEQADKLGLTIYDC